MRSDEEVLNQIRDWAEKWDNIRAVVITGSHARPDYAPDALSDFDVEVYVSDLEPILRDDAWLDPFGSIMVRWPLRPAATFDEKWITQLVVFDDYVRIDFQFTTSSHDEITRYAGPFKAIVDKDQLAPRSLSGARVQRLQARPSSEEFEDRLNAFWWDIPYVAKELRRGELEYARYILDGTIRHDKLLPLLKWHVGATLGWTVDSGRYRQWIDCLLGGPFWERYLETSSGPSAEETWIALYRSIELVRDVGTSLAESLGYDYPHDVDVKVTRYIKWIQGIETGDIPEFDPR